MKNKKILGVNISHDSSICQLTDGDIDFYFEENRFNKKKEYTPSESELTKYICIDKHANQKYDEVIFTSWGREKDENNNKEYDYVIIEDIKKQLPLCENFSFYPKNHHIYHAYCGFYFSKMKEALCIVMDGFGARPYKYKFQEIESIYFLTENSNTCYYKHMSNALHVSDGSEVAIDPYTEKDGITELKYSSLFSSGTKFAKLTYQLKLGWGGDGSGKTMGLSSYGNLVGDLPQDRAKRLQVETKNDTIELIKKAISYNDCKNIVLTGGYALNCVNNYEYVKEFPEYNFFVDPVAYDGGTAIGAALWLYKNEK